MKKKEIENLSKEIEIITKYKNFFNSLSQNQFSERIKIMKNFDELTAEEKQEVNNLFEEYERKNEKN